MTPPDSCTTRGITANLAASRQGSTPMRDKAVRTVMSSPLLDASRLSSCLKAP